MKITTVSYQKAFVIGPYLQEKVGLEASLDPGDDEQGVLEWLKEKVEKFHADNNPEQVDNAFNALTQAVITEKPIPADQRIAVIIADIYSCKELKVLESYKLMVKGNPELETAYEEMKNKLSK